MQTGPHHGTGRAGGEFPTDPAGLPAATRPALLELADGETFDLRIEPVAKRLRDNTVRMLGYNGSVPGPTLKVRQGSQISVNVTNYGDLETTVHWHGLRLENQYDGVPHETQMPIPIGGSFTYRLQFPDPGLYWYHPHIREDYTQELGLYGNILVVPTEPEYWPPVNREVVLTLDDVLIEPGRIAPFGRAETTYAAMGRYGNLLLVGGETDLQLPVAEILLAPSERAVVDVLVDQPGELTLEHRTPDRVYRLAAIRVDGEPATAAFDREFEVLRGAPELEAERLELARWLAAPPDKTLSMVAEMDDLAGPPAPGEPVAYVCPMHPEVTSPEPGRCPTCGMKLLAAAGHEHGGHEHRGDGEGHGEGHDHGAAGGIEWEDDMVEVNRLTTDATMRWKLVDGATGATGAAIDWRFTVGDRVKIRLVNQLDSDHPMQHPFHLHGAGRFLVLERDGVTEPNLVWKDTVLVRTGQVVDILFDVTNSGMWMAHCHIAEHMQSGMMFSFQVTRDGSP